MVGKSHVADDWGGMNELKGVCVCVRACVRACVCVLAVEDIINS